MDRNDVVLGSSAVHPRIARQRTELVLSQPFFGALALRLNVREDPTAKTFWVDGETLGYNPTYMESLSDLEVRGVVAHEVLHVANGHCWRQGARDPDRWNDACDYAINPIVLSSGMVLPKGALVDPRYTGKSAEEIYGLLTQEAKQKQQQNQSPQHHQQPQNQQPQPSPQDQQQPSGKQPSKPGGQNGTAPGQSPGDQPLHPGSFGEVRSYKGPDKPVKEAEWKVAVTQAAKAAAMRGKLPGDLQAMAGGQYGLSWIGAQCCIDLRSNRRRRTTALQRLTAGICISAFICRRCIHRRSAMRFLYATPAAQCSTRRRRSSTRRFSRSSIR
jgi:hypothetical protein